MVFYSFFSFCQFPVHFYVTGTAYKNELDHSLSHCVGHIDTNSKNRITLKWYKWNQKKSKQCCVMLQKKIQFLQYSIKKLLSPYIYPSTRVENIVSSFSKGNNEIKKSPVVTCVFATVLFFYIIWKKEKTLVINAVKLYMSILSTFYTIFIRFTKGYLYLLCGYNKSST